jgi:hypothetical protein
VIVLTAAKAVVVDGTGNTDCRFVFVVAAAARLAPAARTSTLENMMTRPDQQKGDQQDWMVVGYIEPVVMISGTKHKNA